MSAVATTATRPATARTKTAAKVRATVARRRLDRDYASYDSTAISRALLAAQAASGDWVARQRLAGAL